MKKKITLVLAALHLAMIVVVGQNSTLIWGTIEDEKGNPLPFATILLGNGNGTEADFDGFFEIEIPTDAATMKLTASHCGHQPKTVTWENSGNLDEINFKLKEGIELATVEVVFERNRVVTDMIVCGGRIIQDEWRDLKLEIQLLDLRKLEVYPNPFISTLNVEMEVKTAQAYLFHLYNEAGQLVFAESRELEAGLQSLQLDLVKRHLPEGAYFLRISDDAGEIRTKRLVKVSP